MSWGCWLAMPWLLLRPCEPLLHCCCHTARALAAIQVYSLASAAAEKLCCSASLLALLPCRHDAARGSIAWLCTACSSPADAQAAQPSPLPPATLLRRHPDLVGNVVGGFNAVNGEDPANFLDLVRLDTRLACVSWLACGGAG